MDEGTSASIPCPVCNVISRGGDYEESLIKLVQTGIHLTDHNDLPINVLLRIYLELM